MNHPLEVSLPLHVDSTMLSCFRSCQKKFYWQDIRGLHHKATSPHLHAGGVFAAALERYYLCIYLKNMDHTIALGHALALFDKQWGDYVPPARINKTQDRMAAALIDYVETYPVKMDRFQPYLSEERPTYEFTFAVPLDFAGFPLHPSGDPFIYTGRADALGTYDGLPCLRDEKTTGSIGQMWAQQWDLRGQFIGYCWAAQMSGLSVEQVLVRGIGILKTEIKQAEALKLYPQHLISNWFQTLKQDLIDLREAWDRDYFKYNFGEACAAYGGCQFNPLCVAKDPEPWTVDYEIRHWNPLARDPVGDLEAAS